MPEHIARKRFGQNFLEDRSTIDNIVGAVNPQNNEAIIEIGPGLGAITAPLLKRSGKLHVIELDKNIIPLLEKNCADIGGLVVHNCDVLKFDFTEFKTDYADKQSHLRVVGNLPYNISTPILFHLVKHLPCFSDMHLMLQKEVVDRITANPGSKDYSRLSVMLQVCCSTESLFEIGPESFNPQPKVTSALLRLTPDSRYIEQVDDPDFFASLVKLAFSQRRKTLRNSLNALCTRDDIMRADIDPGIRAERLTLEDFIRLSNLLSPLNSVS